MKRYTGQKALYEAIARTRAKSQRRGILELLHPGNGKEEAPAAAVESVVDELMPPVSQVEIEPAKVPEKKPEKKPELKPEPEPELELDPDPVVVVEKPPAPVVKPVRPALDEPRPQPYPAKPWLRPKAVQLHDGRIEISLPYTIGVTVLLISILLMLGAFRLGQMQPRVQPPVAKNTMTNPAQPVVPETSKPEPALTRPEPAAPAVAETVAPPATSSAGVLTTSAAKPGDHVIVLAQQAQRNALDSAKAWFKEHGVTTEVIPVAALRDYLAGQGINTSVLGTRGGYMLVTADYYDNPKNPGTDGYKARQKIVELGKSYKGTAGAESFAPNYFSDAYGMKVR